MEPTNGKPTRPYVILFFTSGPLKGRKVAIRDRTTVIMGRGLDCNLRIPEHEDYRGVSRHHCRMDVNPPMARIRDLGSLNGTYVGDQVIGHRRSESPLSPGDSDKFAEHVLRDGDRFRLGQATFGIRLIDPSAGKKSKPKPGGRYCSLCEKSVSEGARFDHPSDQFCRECRDDPAAALKVLMKGVKAGEEILAPLRGLKLLRTLGRGSTGAVYLAQHKKTGDPMALKILFPEMAVNDWARESFLREVSNTQSLDHPNVVRLFDSGSYKGVFFYTMEYCNGGSMDTLMAKRGGLIPLEEAVQIILNALDGLGYIHQAEIPNVKLADGKIGKGRGLVHRDLKPANIFLSGSAPDWTSKIADVGVGKAFDMAGLSGQTMTGSVAGSPVVSPRQQVINFKYAKPDVDVWAMAATLYHVLTGHYPRDFDQPKDPWLIVLETNPVPIRERNPNVPERLAQVIDTALIDNPEIYFKTAADFKKALEDIT